jgi:hypothetical protein
METIPWQWPLRDHKELDSQAGRKVKW